MALGKSSILFASPKMTAPDSEAEEETVYPSGSEFMARMAERFRRISVEDDTGVQFSVLAPLSHLATIF